MPTVGNPKDPQYGIADAIRRARADRNEECAKRMKDYDRDLFQPTLAALRDQCGRHGHIAGSVHNNGFGGSLEECIHCGSRMSQK